MLLAGSIIRSVPEFCQVIKLSNSVESVEHCSGDIKACELQEVKSINMASVLSIKSCYGPNYCYEDTG